MKTLYPEIEPFNEFSLDVGNGHNIHVEQCGNPEGASVVFLHGGPGGGIQPSYRQYFDPKKYHIVLFDQRGCGKSTPFANLEHNTTWDLVEDINRIKNHLKISKWSVFGGSWGSTLALAYAQAYPQDVNALFLRGIFLLRKKEVDWFYQEGASKIFSDTWEQFLSPIEEDKRGDLLSAYHEILTGDDKQKQIEAAKCWSVWEASASKLIQNKDLMEDFSDPEFAIAFARIECHFFKNKGFLDTDNYLIKNAHKLKDIPTIIVQGRYDIVCPVESAWELSKAMPHAKLVIIDDAGHSLSEKGITSELISATDRYADQGTL